MHVIIRRLSNYCNVVCFVLLYGTIRNETGEEEEEEEEDDNEDDEEEYLSMLLII